MVPSREMTNRKSILPLQPIGGPPKSGIMPISGSEVPVVDDEPVLPSALPLDVLEVPDDPSPVEVDSPELVSLGRVVTPGVVKPVDDWEEPLQASPRRPTATAKRAGSIAAQSSAEPPRSQVGRACDHSQSGLHWVSKPALPSDAIAGVAPSVVAPP